MKKLILLFSMLIASFVVYSQTAKEYNKMGNAKFEVMDFAGAIEDYNKAISIDSNYAPAYLNRSTAKTKLKDFQGSAADLGKVFLLASKNKTTYQPSEIVKDKKMDSLNKSLGHDSKKSAYMLAANLYYKSGCTKYKEKDFTGAIADFDKVIKLDPEYAVAYIDRGVARYCLLDFKGAIADYNQALKIIKKNASRKKSGDLQKSSPANYKSVMSNIYKDMELNIDPADIYFNRGMAKAENQNFKGANSDFDMVINLHPSDAIAYYHRGLVKIKSGRKEAGASDLAEARKLEDEKESEKIKGSKNYNMYAGEWKLVIQKFADHEGIVDVRGRKGIFANEKKITISSGEGNGLLITTDEYSETDRVFNKIEENKYQYIKGGLSYLITFTGSSSMEYIEIATMNDYKVSFTYSGTKIN